MSWNQCPVVIDPDKKTAANKIVQWMKLEQDLLNGEVPKNVFIKKCTIPMKKRPSIKLNTITIK